VANITKFSRRYFGKGHAWFSQKLNNCLVLERKRQFTQEEIQTISNAYKDLAQQLIDYSEELERAKDIDEN
jgi:acyl-[acyl carrier protein]--UDP-N-acetylglucosamine O-acyltransferase